MRHRLIGSFVMLLCSMLLVNTAHADLRVLIKFDGDAHSLHRIVSVETINPALLNEQVANSIVELTPGKASVRWLDADGAIVFSENINDPRLTHAPLGNGAETPTMVSLSNGAYMVSGPSGSRILQVRLPAINALALSAQTLEFQLTL